MSNNDATILSFKFPFQSLEAATVAYFSVLDVPVSVQDLTDGLPIKDSGLTTDLLERATRRVGYLPVWFQAKTISEHDLPCCVAFGEDEYLVVIEKNGESLYVLDPERPETFRAVSEEFFLGRFSGRAFSLRATVDQLQKKHVSQPAPKHWFWGRLVLKKSTLFDIFISSLFANVLAVVTSLFAMQVYDRVIPGQSEATLWVLAGGVGMAILFEAVLRISRSKLIDRLGRSSELEISQDVFSRVIGMKLDSRPASPGAIVSIVREFSSIREFFTSACVGVVSDLPFAFVFLALIYFIAGNVVWVVIAGSILIIIPSIVFRKRMAEISSENMGGISAASRLMTEVSYSLESIKVNRMEGFFQRQWEEILELNSEKTSIQRNLGTILNQWGGSMQQVTYVAAIIAGVYMVFAGELSVGAILAISILSSRTLAPFTQFSQILLRWQNMKIALSALDTVMNSTQDEQPDKQYVRKSRLGDSVELDQVRFAFPNTKILALTVDNLKVPCGDRVALMGANGSGKSTLLKLIGKIHEPIDGRVLIDGIDARQISTKDIRGSIGYLSQDVKLYRGSLRENLIGYRSAHDDVSLLDALSFVGLGDFIRQHPEGLDLEILDGGDGLSMGQRQSIGLARIILQDPSIILLDEPTSAMDQSIESVVVERIGKWIEGRTCIVATHRPRILSQVNRVLVLHNGRIVLDEPREIALRKLSTGNRGLVVPTATTS
ncbi:type I secretion system permease/ATPase [Nioella sp. MMSF_3534]|uniref:type I secretion system permease/ATPase n=1 Tax=Nioella sp. MMSF_3534 TaxID=3046720 RepID=UPI00273E1EB3|nr:type I secretion system permease/ATPase [Nioella sp. MMSF_3534]